MSFLGRIFGSGAGETATAIGGLANDLADVFTTSDREKLAAYTAETDRLRASNEVAVAQSRHSSVFVAGARPAMIWVCAIGMAYHFLIWRIFGPILEHYTGIVLVDIDWQELAVAMTTVMGLGGLRTYEKKKGVARDRIK